MDRPIYLEGGVEIPASEIDAEYSRASGPGGQHVNKTETRVTLRLNIAESPSLPDTVRARLLEKLASRLTKTGELLISSDKHRERGRNMADAAERMQELLSQALVVPKKRKPTKPSRGAQERRLKDKRITSEKKKGRRGDFD